MVKKKYFCSMKNAETISHEGIVSMITDDELEIKILAQSACAACPGTGMPPADPACHAGSADSPYRDFLRGCFRAAVSVSRE